jgi:protein subunit release factor A
MIRKKPVKKQAVKKKAVKKYSRRMSGTHTDKKSHNVKINVLSGIDNLMTEYKKYLSELNTAKKLHKKEKDNLMKMYINAHRIAPTRYKIKQIEEQIKETKKRLK